MSKGNGFSLVEALVALVILSVVFSAVWEWFSVATTSTQKIERALSYPELFDQFTNRMSLVSLESTREGEVVIGDYRVQWVATPQRLSSQEIYNRQRVWEVALFQIDANIIHKGQPVAEFSTQMVDYWRDENDIRSIFGL